MNHKPLSTLCALVMVVAGGALALSASAVELASGPKSTANYPTLQAAIDANPGGELYLPAGDHPLDMALIVNKDGLTLRGPGRLVQRTPNQSVLQIHNCNNVTLRDITVTRPSDGPDGASSAIYCQDAGQVRIENVSVLGNRSQNGAIKLDRCQGCRIAQCEITDYKTIGVDDRTDNPLLSYAFRCIDGTGIVVSGCQATQIIGNRVIERRLLPTREIVSQHGLGQLIEGRKPSLFGELGKGIQSEGFVRQWHQGSAIAVTGPRNTAYTRIADNYIENCAQGIDIHSDNFLCTGNIVNHAMIGMKAMHGSRNGIVSNNLFSFVDLWAIMLGPGASSDVPHPATEKQPAVQANDDGGTLVTGNVVSDFGYGHDYWNWSGDTSDSLPSGVIRIERGQLASNPPLTDVLIHGNVVTGRASENPQGDQPPRYQYALRIDVTPEGSGERDFPGNIRVGENLFAPGVEGVCNTPLPLTN
jgi:hypothetical protein